MRKKKILSISLPQPSLLLLYEPDATSKTMVEHILGMDTTRVRFSQEALRFHQVNDEDYLGVGELGHPASLGQRRTQVQILPSRLHKKFHM